MKSGRVMKLMSGNYKQLKDRSQRRSLTRRAKTSTLTAEGYRVKYLVGGNASHARLLRCARLFRQEKAE